MVEQLIARLILLQLRVVEHIHQKLDHTFEKSVLLNRWDIISSALMLDKQKQNNSHNRKDKYDPQQKYTV